MMAHDARSSAKPARFDASNQARRVRLAKVHIAKKQLRLDDDDYRQILFDETGQTSAGDCTAAQLDTLLQRFEALGFKPVPKNGGSKPARHPMASKARAMWISLHQLGVVRNPNEGALEVFASRQLGCDRLAWAKQSHGGKLIEALKSMAVEAGWAQTDKDGNNLGVRALKEGLCKAILARMVELGEAPDHWTIDDAAWRLCGIDTASTAPMSAEGYTDLAAALGAKLREALARAEPEAR